MKIKVKILLILSLSINTIIFFFVFTPFTNWLYANLEVKPEIKEADAIILLSAGNYTEEIFERNTYQRMLHAVKLYKMGKADKIIVCGGVQKEGAPAISEMMKKFLVYIGIAEDAIITEKESQNTYENIKNILPLLNNHNITKSLLVTSSYHMYRSLAICQKLKLDVCAAPVTCYEKDITKMNVRVRFILDILREYVAIVYFRLKGWV